MHACMHVLQDQDQLCSSLEHSFALGGQPRMLAGIFELTLLGGSVASFTQFGRVAYLSIH